MDERRQEERSAFERQAWAGLDGELVECRIVEISQSGARLEIATTVPHLFRLYPEAGRKAPRLCQVVWQEGGRVGINFLDA